MSREAFSQYLRETHLPLVTKLPGLRRSVLNWVLPDPNGPPPAYDAVAEDWFDDPAAMGAALASPEGERSPPTCQLPGPGPVRALGRGGRTFPCPQDPPRPLPAEASPETVPSRFSPSLGPLILARTRHHHGRPQ